MDALSDTPPRPAPAVRTGRRWLTLVLALPAGLLLTELGLRWLLFGGSDSARDLAERWDLRRAGLYASQDETDFWKLRRLLLPEDEGRWDPPNLHDPLLGWRAPKILANYDHERRSAIAGRRPVLLYGASFAARGFEGAFAETELEESYALISYAVGGYGPDQVLLLLRESLPYFRDLDPIVVFGFVASGDFGRAALDLRTWPRPRSRVGDDGRVEFDPEPVEEDLRAYFAAHPVRIRSYLWNAVVHTMLPGAWRYRLTGAAARQAEIDALITAVVRDLSDVVVSSGLDAFFVLFHNPRDMASNGPRTREEAFVTRLLREEGLPFVSSRPVLRAASRSTGIPIRDFFVRPPDPAHGHPSPNGVRALVECFRRCLRGEFEFGPARAGLGRPKSDGPNR